MTHSLCTDMELIINWSFLSFTASAAPKEYEAVYLLAGDPDVIKLGKDLRPSWRSRSDKPNRRPQQDSVWNHIRIVHVPSQTVPPHVLELR